MFFKDYDMNVFYHPDKANIAVDTLSRLPISTVAHVKDEKTKLA